jgi:hypothetical protein
MRVFLASTLLAALLSGCSDSPPDARFWEMHVIDDSYSGADGVDIVDIDNDGDADAVVGWEESGMLLLHENPGPALVREPWGHTAISGGLAVGKIEDARFADFNADGVVDAVVSATEKGSERVGVHWLAQPRQPHSEGAWQGTWLDQSLPYLYLKVAIGQIDGDGAKDIVAGSKTKGKAGALVWYIAPAAPGPGTADQWRSHFIDQIDWIDSLAIIDINGDGRNDLLLNYWNNLLWYENLGPGPGAGKSTPPRWQKHLISNTTGSYFADCSNGAGAGELLVVGADLSSAGPGDVVLYLVGRVVDASGQWDGLWLQREIRTSDPLPRQAGDDDYAIKGIACGNIDADERLDIVVSMSGRGHGVFALMNMDNSLTDQTLRLEVIASDEFNSRKGIKHDNLVLQDLDGDGALDIITTEENGARGLLSRLLPGLITRGLGLIWYENPGSTAAE